MRCSYLINASRGQVVDLASLAESIKSGRVAGAAVDVYPTEPETNSDGFQTGACLPGASKLGHAGPVTPPSQAVPSWRPVPGQLLRCAASCRRCCMLSKALLR